MSQHRGQEGDLLVPCPAQVLIKEFLYGAGGEMLKQPHCSCIRA